MEARRGIAEVLRDPQGRDRKYLPSLHRPGPEAAVPSRGSPNGVQLSDRFQRAVARLQLSIHPALPFWLCGQRRLGIRCALHPPRIRRRRSFPPLLPSPHRPVASLLLRSFAFPGPEPDRERRTPTSALSARTPAQLLVRLTSSDGAPILWPH